MVIKNPQYNIGTNVSDTTATPADVLAPKEFHQADGQKVQGTIPTYAGATTITENGTVETAGKYLASDINVNIKTRVAGRPNDVVFYDYDGTELYDYSKAEFLALTELPANPSHEGLVAEGWNWTLADAQDYVRDYGKLNIGQFYHTESGNNELIIELTKATGLTVTENGAVATDWGDGTTDSTGTHTYATYGKYTISISQNTVGNGNARIFTNNRILVEARLKTGVVLNSYAFNSCTSLKFISRPQSIGLGAQVFGSCSALIILICYNEGYETMQYMSGLKVVCTSKNTDLAYSGGMSCFGYAANLRFIALSKRAGTISANARNFVLEEAIIPEGITGLPEAFRQCENLRKLIIPSTVTNTYYVVAGCTSLEELELKEGITSIGNSAVNGCNSLKRIKMPSTVTSIGNSAFSGCYNLEIVDFSDATVIPTLGTNAFQNAYTVKIVVPDALYESWIVATNWASYANYIYKASEVQL